MEIGLVSCVAQKRDEPARPKDLYRSDYFRKMRQYAEQIHDRWYILSAEHDLLVPDGPPIGPYDTTLTSASVATKRDWAADVVAALEDEIQLGPSTTVVIHAGKDYYQELVPLLEARDTPVEIPTEGLRIGETKAWYKERL